jgi:hypothetical protein
MLSKFSSPSAFSTLAMICGESHKPAKINHTHCAGDCRHIVSTSQTKPKKFLKNNASEQASEASGAIHILIKYVAQQVS